MCSFPFFPIPYVISFPIDPSTEWFFVWRFWILGVGLCYCSFIVSSVHNCNGFMATSSLGLALCFFGTREGSSTEQGGLKEKGTKEKKRKVNDILVREIFYRFNFLLLLSFIFIYSRPRANLACIDPPLFPLYCSSVWNNLLSICFLLLSLHTPCVLFSFPSSFFSLIDK